MEQSKELKTAKFVNRAVKKTYESLKYNKNKKYVLKIYCNSKDNINFKYYFEVDKNDIPIYKRGLKSINPIQAHRALYSMLFNYMKQDTFLYCMLNSNRGIFNLILKNNFEIIINYDNDIDRLFFEDIFMNYKRDIEEDKVKAEKTLKK